LRARARRSAIGSANAEARAVGITPVGVRRNKGSHRNPILGRTMTEEEQDFLDQGGYAG